MINLFLFNGLALSCCIGLALQYFVLEKIIRDELIVDQGAIFLMCILLGWIAGQVGYHLAAWLISFP